MGAARIMVIRIVKTITGSFRGSSGRLFNHMQVLNLGIANVIQLHESLVFSQNQKQNTPCFLN
jgi:hypothetical protein